MLNIQIKNFSQMETVAHQYLTKLRIIAKIPENGQLDLTNNDLNIYNSTLMNWVYRKIQGDGKINTVAYLNSFYREINGFTSELMKSIEIEQNTTSKIHKIILLARVAEKIKESNVGLNNLMKTYRHYHKIISTLESIQQDIIDNQLNNIIKCIPEIFKPEILRDTENVQSDNFQESEEEETPSLFLKGTSSMPIDIPNAIIIGSSESNIINSNKKNKK